MEIIMKRIDELKEYENNPRKNDEAVDQVASSIKEFGFKNPIIIDSNNVIIAGHTRLKASRKLGLSYIPCIVASDLTKEQINAFRLADNKTAEIAKWDKKKLDEELRKIDWDSIDMESFGFDNIFLSDPIEVSDDDFDEGQYLSSEPYSKQGDVFILGRHRLMCGDSTSKEAVEKLLDGKKADMVFTDPPYNVNYEGSDGMTIQNDNMASEDFYKFLLEAFKNLYDSLKSGGVIYVCHADSQGKVFRLAFEDAGFKLAQCLIWVKNSFTLGKQDYQWQHEPILYGWKEGGAHYFVDNRALTTIWEYDKPRHNDLHPTMKPLELVGQAINNASRKDELILDLFGGSGSTLIASEQASRSSCLMELDEKYVDVIVKRYLKFKGQIEDCYLIRNDEKIPLSSIEEYASVLDN